MDMSLGNRIVSQEIVIQRLLSEARLIGGVYTMGFDECLVLTNDLWKKQAGGVPQHCFLLATAMVPNQTPDPDDEEVILLRVVGPAPLPSESELVQVRAEAMREMIVNRGSQESASQDGILDVLTRNEIQFSAFRAKVLGTFYDREVNGRGMLSFGSDLDSYYSASRYKVYKPFGQSLMTIVSYPENTEEEECERQAGRFVAPRLQIGSVRYSSTTRRRQISENAVRTSVPVRVCIKDFVGMKTAVFGMTRLGKSNTMKTIATAVCRFAAESGQRIGQLLFDPAGEYANVNVQDQTALSRIGSEFVTIFRYGASGNEPGIRPLTSNFFSDETIEVTWAIVSSLLRTRTNINYIQSFLSADVIGPEDFRDDPSAYNRARRRRAALFGVFMKAGFQVPPNFATTIAANGTVVDAVNAHSDVTFQSDHRGNVRIRGQELTAFWDGLLAAINHKVNLGDWVDAGLDAILRVYAGTVGSGWRLIEPLRVYHSPNRTDDYAEEVLKELIRGKIVIVDLSLGSETILRFCSERIVNHIVQNAARRFAEGREAHQIQIYIEEAHRLFNRDRMNVPEEADPYVRLAKEAAKFKIGLIYATQEVSSVDPQILANTSNWVVTHLNNQAEVKELCKYYDFEDFKELTLKAEDVGFARVKTRSGRYIIPVQIALFDDAMVQEARQACLRAAESRVGREG